jgi:hypothetical protein
MRERFIITIFLIDIDQRFSYFLGEVFNTVFKEMHKIVKIFWVDW